MGLRVFIAMVSSLRALRGGAACSLVFYRPGGHSVVKVMLFGEKAVDR